MIDGSAPEKQDRELELELELELEPLRRDKDKDEDEDEDPELGRLQASTIGKLFKSPGEPPGGV